jgi:hypothetical protein
MTEDIVARIAGLIVTGFLVYVGIFNTAQYQRKLVSFGERSPELDWFLYMSEVADSRLFFWMMRFVGWVSLPIWCSFLWGLIRDIEAIVRR